MRPFEVISLDMFQTLVNVDSRKEHIWEKILQGACTYEKTCEYAELLLDQYYLISAEAKKTNRFVLTRDIYISGFEKIIAEHNIPCDSIAAVEVLFHEHRLSELYEETEDVLRQLIKEYPVCIVSDTDIQMLPDFYKNYDDIRLFASEQYQSYKNDHNNRMFQEVIQHYGVNPGQILHIGDSVSDILGAKRAGMSACWINRNQQQWSKDIQPEPDYIIQNLDEIFEIIKGSVVNR